MLNQDILTAAADNIECQRRDVSSSVTQQPNRLLSPRARRLISLLCGLAFLPLGIALANPNPPTNLCIEGSPDCEGVPTPPAGGVKWHPGHYMQILRGSYDANQSIRFNHYDKIASNSDIVGVVVSFRWSQLESSQGNYSSGIALVQSEINYLKNLPAPKRLFIRMNDNAWGSSCPASSTFPSYLNSNGWLFSAKAGCIWRRWNSAAMGHFINMWLAYAAAFDDEPYFEGLYLVRETASGWGGSTPPSDYSNNALDTQYRRLVSEVGPAFEKSNVILPANWYISVTKTNDIFSHMQANQVGEGNPDTCEDCNMWGDLTVRGLSGGVDYRGVIPIMYSIEGSELGGNYVGPDGGYTPTELYTWLDETIRASHVFWDRNINYGTSEQLWSTGILPFIESNPTLTYDSCPSIYDQGCNPN